MKHSLESEKTVLRKSNVQSNDNPPVIGLDIGHQHVKGSCSGKLFSFPAYSRQVPENREPIEICEESDILYKDDTGTWSIGNSVYDESNCSVSADYKEEFCRRKVYYSPMYLMLARTGIVLGMAQNLSDLTSYKKFTVQISLPASYCVADAPILKEVLSGSHTFDICIGNGKWQHLEFNLEESDIHVIPHPRSSFTSALSALINQ